jgi:hypothetical protein
VTKPSLAQVVEYICATYPHQYELSNARLTKLVYLADWRAARTGVGQLTPIRWIFNTYGPWVPDVLETAKTDPNLVVSSTTNAYGAEKRLIGVRDETKLDPGALLDPDSRAIVDSVIADTQGMYFGQFIDYVYDTPPVRESHRQGILDLNAFAQSLGDAERKPLDLSEAGITATEYAKVRDAVDKALAVELLGTPLSQLSQVTFEDEVPLVKGLRVDTLDLDPRMPLSRRAPHTWQVSASGIVRLSAIFPSVDLGVPSSLAEFGYEALRTDWVPGEIVIGLRMKLNAILTVAQGRTYSATTETVVMRPVANPVPSP